MDNYFVSSCKRVKDWICRQFGQKEKKTVHHKKFADGGEVIVWETDGQVKKRRRMRIYFSAKKSQDFARIYVVSSPVP